MSRRTVMSVGLAALVLPASLLPGTASAHTDLVLVNFGGTAARAQMLALLRPWEQARGKHAEMLTYDGGLT